MLCAARSVPCTACMSIGLAPVLEPEDLEFGLHQPLSCCSEARYQAGSSVVPDSMGSTARPGRLCHRSLG